MKKGGITTKGFTIVELLIVIVVIAILAAITIVAYNGIQNRAKNTQMVSATVAYVKAIELYATTNNDTLPMATTAVQCFNGIACWAGTDVSASQALRTELSKVISSLPTFPAGQVALVTSGTTNDFVNGGNYTGWYVLYQVINTNGECPAVGGLRYLNFTLDGSMRNCRGALVL